MFTIHYEPITNCHIRHICRRTAKLAGNRYVTPQMLRHTFATRLLEQGASVKAVSRWLGHKDEAFTIFLRMMNTMKLKLCFYLKRQTLNVMSWKLLNRNLFCRHKKRLINMSQKTKQK